MGMKISEICFPSQNLDFIKQCIQKSQYKAIRELDFNECQFVNECYQLRAIKKYENGREYGVLFNEICFYEGQIKNKCAEGKGVFKKIDKVQYNGDFKNNSAHGEGQYQTPKIIFCGRWVQGKPKNGIITVKQTRIRYLIHKINLEEQVGYQAGVVQLELQSQYKYQGFISKVNDSYEFEGSGMIIYTDGSFYEGNWKNGLMHGKGKYIWPDRIHKYQGNYVRGVKHGLGKYFVKEYQYYYGEWKNGKKQGIFKYIQKINNNEVVRYENEFQNDKAKGGSSFLY